MNKLKKNQLTLIAIVLGIAGLLFVPVKLPYSVKSYGKILPVKKWVLVQGTNGQLMTRIYNYKTGMNEEYSILQLAGEGTMRFNLHPSIFRDNFVDIGDTIGIVYSSKTEERLVELTGAIATAKVTLTVSTGGRKQSVIEEAKQRLAYAKVKATEQQKILARSQDLFRKDLISEEEFEIVKGKANLLNIEVSIAESQLVIAQSGKKSEQINLINSQIEALEQQIASLQKRRQSFTITAPLRGIITRIFSMDTLLAISDVTAYVAVIPIEWNKYSYIAEAQPVNISINGFSKIARGRIVSINEEIYVLGRNQVLVALAMLYEFSETLLPGMICRVVISCNPATPFEYVKRFFKLIT